MLQQTSNEQRHTHEPFCDHNDAASRHRLRAHERQPSCFAFEEELGEQWSGHGAMLPLINKSKATL